MNCYAEKMAARFSGDGFERDPWGDDPHSIDCTCDDCEHERKNERQPFYGFAEFRIIGDRREAHWTGKVELIESKLLEPLSWRKKALRFAQENGRKPRVFISMSDLFHERLPDEAIDRVLAVMALAPGIDFLVLTKRADRMEHYQTSRAKSISYWEKAARSFGYTFIFRDLDGRDSSTCPFPLTNVWLGVSVEDQKRADERIDHLRRTPAAVRFLSVEPMLEEIRINLEGIDWVICGGESGPGARPFDLAWARSLRDQCKAAGVLFFMKQAGSLPHDGERVLYGVGPYGPAKEGLEPVWLQFKDKKGGDPAEWPGDVRIQEVRGMSLTPDQAPDILLPCPFCGGLPNSKWSGPSAPCLEQLSPEVGGGWRVVCYGCGVQTWNRLHQHKEQAIKHWNTRRQTHG